MSTLEEDHLSTASPISLPISPLNIIIPTANSISLNNTSVTNANVPNDTSVTNTMNITNVPSNPTVPTRVEASQHNVSMGGTPDDNCRTESNNRCLSQHAKRNVTNVTNTKESSDRSNTNNNNGKKSSVNTCKMHANIIWSQDTLEID